MTDEDIATALTLEMVRSEHLHFRDATLDNRVHAGFLLAILDGIVRFLRDRVGTDSTRRVVRRGIRHGWELFLRLWMRHLREDAERREARATFRDALASAAESAGALPPRPAGGKSPGSSITAMRTGMWPTLTPWFTRRPPERSAYHASTLSVPTSRSRAVVTPSRTMRRYASGVLPCSCRSTKPGATTWPPASIVSRPRIPATAPVEGSRAAR